MNNKCRKCGASFYGNYCPNCGAKAADDGSDYYPEFDSAPYNEKPKKHRGADYAVIALVLGIVSVVIAFTASALVYVLAIAAIVFGALALKNRTKKGKPIAAIILGSVAILLVVAIRIFAVSIIYHGLTGKEIDRGGTSQNEYSFYDILPDIFGDMGMPDFFFDQDTPDMFSDSEIPDFIIPD